MTKQLSQTALYGELQTSTHQYQNEIERIPSLTQEQEQALVERAREGDTQAKNEIIESCLRYVEYWARKIYRTCSWQSWRIEYEELLGVGNMVLVNVIEGALTKEKPLGYLKGAAKLQMGIHSRHNRSIIPTPNHGCHDIPVESLDVPLSCSENMTLSDLLEDLSYYVEGEKSFDALYKALDALTEKQRETVKQLYGLDEYACESMSKVAGETMSKQAIFKLKDDAFVKLRILMPSPDTCEEVYTVEQACHKLGTKKQNLFYWVRKYNIKPIFLGLYLRRDIEQIEQTQTMMNISA